MTDSGTLWLLVDLYIVYIALLVLFFLWSELSSDRWVAERAAELLRLVDEGERKGGTR